MGVGLLMIAGGAAAGVFGSLLGLGGGILIVPLLTLGFGLDLREAVGVSLVSVIMTSSAAAGVYLERHVANLRLGMSLELFTAIGALVGGSIAFLLDERLLSVLFAGLLVYVVITMLRAGAPATVAASPVDGTRPGRLAPDLSGRTTWSATWGSASSGRPGLASRRRSSASAVASSRSRSCTSRWACRCGSRRQRATS
jgi:uncharacterized membrane protein YfcA